MRILASFIWIIHSQEGRLSEMFTMAITGRGVIRKLVKTFRAQSVVH